MSFDETLFDETSFDKTAFDETAFDEPAGYQYSTTSTTTENIGRQILAILQTAIYGQKIIIILVFANANVFAESWRKIAANIDHNIAPWSQSYYFGIYNYNARAVVPRLERFST
jgi:hypothetical protein